MPAMPNARVVSRMLFLLVRAVLGRDDEGDLESALQYAKGGALVMKIRVHQEIGECIAPREARTRDAGTTASASRRKRRNAQMRFSQRKVTRMAPRRRALSASASM